MFETLVIVVALLGAVTILFTIGSWIAVAVQRSKLKTSLPKEYPGANILVSSHDASYLVVDTSAKQVVIGSSETANAYRKTYHFKHIVSVELLCDGTTISSTNRGSQIVGVAVGALALGGAGAILGGMSASKTVREHFNNVALRITVDDSQTPLHVITLLKLSDDGKGIQKGHSVLQHYLREAETFEAHLINAMRKAVA